MFDWKHKMLVPRKRGKTTYKIPNKFHICPWVISETKNPFLRLCKSRASSSVLVFSCLVVFSNSFFYFKPQNLVTASRIIFRKKNVLKIYSDLKEFQSGLLWLQIINFSQILSSLSDTPVSRDFALNPLDEWLHGYIENKAWSRRNYYEATG